VGLPSECRMPDLSGLDFLMNRLMVQALIGEPGLSQKTRLYRRNFVRLVDKALREYGEAREAILAQIAEMNRSPQEMMKDGRSIYLFAFTDHIETCINATRRLYGLLPKIYSERQSPFLPRELRKLLETMQAAIVDIRNAIEHIDDMIQKDEIAHNRPIMATGSKNWDAVVVAKEEIEFEDLAMVLSKMHEIALYLLTIKKANSTSSV
jgi:hypothetical protein